MAIRRLWNGSSWVEIDDEWIMRYSRRLMDLREAYDPKQLKGGKWPPDVQAY